MKLTGWYSGNQKPVRKGVYHRKYDGMIYSCYWDGFSFGWGDLLSKDAKSTFKLLGYSFLQDLPWRGVSK